MKAQAGVSNVIGEVGWWWAVVVWVPFALYSRPFIVGDFETYRHLTIAALAGRYDVAGLHISNHISTWQVHALAGLVYMLVAPFQLNDTLRAGHAQLHRRMGYVFVGASLILAVSGSTTMLIHSEFQSLGRIFMGFAGALNLLGLALSISAARHKRFQAHRRWMIRSVVMGYTVISARVVLVLLQKILHIGFGVPIVKEADYSIFVAILVSTTIVELYIHKYVSGEKVD
ncbi:hypothetical protein GOP47_0023890 [Adiantum capillus-veneris]|uniref:DUF2306 domain-containing protein n=1 Tax=Adiantum capillus-veneris TaxID=13818 RepID=A0A9D4U4U6_ADICA|nr:hypothetical protein GOP47_0023890 [Adiantum capillus-veneris]